MIDQIYTPQALAEQMVALARCRRPTRVADFAMGDGALLRAAKERWRSVSTFGLDINDALVRSAPSFDRDGCFGRCDFLASRSRSNSIILRGLQGTVDCVLLNPPFSNRKNERFDVLVAGTRVSCGKALAFILTALEYVRPQGELIAVVPNSVMTSQRDSVAFEFMSQIGFVEIFAMEEGQFKGCSVSTSVIRLVIASSGYAVRSKETSNSVQNIISSRPPHRPSVLITRGNVSAVRRDLKKVGRFDLIHTTNIRQGNIAISGQKTSVGSRVVEGPTIILSRVGRPNRSKLAYGIFQEPVALSNCVIAIQSFPRGEEFRLYSLLRKNWLRLESCYAGCCARYITLTALTSLLEQLGITVSIRPQPQRA